MIRYVFALMLLAGTAAAQGVGQGPGQCFAIARAPGVQYLHRASYRDPLALRSLPARPTVMVLRPEPLR